MTVNLHHLIQYLVAGMFQGVERRVIYKCIRLYLRSKTISNLPREEESRQNIFTPDLRTTEILPTLYSLICWKVSEVNCLAYLYCLMKNTVSISFFLMIPVYHLHQTSKKLLQPLSKVLRCYHLSFKMLSNQLENNMNLPCGFKHIDTE